MTEENRFVIFYNRRFLLWELLLGLLATYIVATQIVHHMESQVINRLQTDSGAIYSVIASVTGSLLGFTITGLAIILAFPPSERLEKLQKSKQFYTIFRVYLSAIIWLALATATSVLGLATKDWETMTIFYVVILSIIVSGARLTRCLWVLKNIVQIKHLDRQGSSPPS